MDEILNINSDNEKKYFIMSKENTKLDVYLIEKKNNYTFSKHLMIICKRGELKNLEKLIICSYNNPAFENEIELDKKERRIKEIKLKNKIVIFVPIFDDDAINNEEFIDSEDLNEYKDHINELINKEKKKLDSKIIENRIIIALWVLIILMIIFIVVFVVYNYSNRDRVIRELEDDPLLKDYIYIRDSSYQIKDKDKITILYNNGNLKYIGPLKNYEADGKGKYYCKEYNKIILYEGNFKKGYPNGNGKRYYYLGNSRIGYYIGPWKNSQRNGKGEMYYISGEYYIGNFENDLREGKGIYYYNDGDYYEGEFMNNKRNGEGKVYNSDDEIKCEGIFLNDEYQATEWEKLKSYFNSKPHCY